MNRETRSTWVFALLIAGLSLGIGAIAAGTENKTGKHKKSPVSKEDRKAIDKIWKEFQEATSGKKKADPAQPRILKREELERFLQGHPNNRGKVLRRKRKEGILFEDPQRTGIWQGDIFLKWPPKGQGPMPRLDRPTDLP